MVDRIITWAFIPGDAAAVGDGVGWAPLVDGIVAGAALVFAPDVGFAVGVTVGDVAGGTHNASVTITTATSFECFIITVHATMHTS